MWPPMNEMFLLSCVCFGNGCCGVPFYKTERSLNYFLSPLRIETSNPPSSYYLCVALTRPPNVMPAQLIRLPLCGCLLTPLIMSRAFTQHRQSAHDQQLCCSSWWAPSRPVLTVSALRPSREGRQLRPRSQWARMTRSWGIILDLKWIIAQFEFSSTVGTAAIFTNRGRQPNLFHTVHCAVGPSSVYSFSGCLL